MLDVTICDTIRLVAVVDRRRLVLMNFDGSIDERPDHVMMSDEQRLMIDIHHISRHHIVSQVGDYCIRGIENAQIKNF